MVKQKRVCVCVRGRAEKDTSVLDVSRGLSRTAEQGQAEHRVCVCTGSSRKRYLCAGCEQRVKQNTGPSRTQSVCVSVCVYRVKQEMIPLCLM